MPSDLHGADAWNRFADVGRGLLVAAALLGPVRRRDSQSEFNGLTAILATHAVAKGVKAFWSERRPNGENNKSFPSQHAGDCFAAAFILKREWPNALGPVAVGLATAVSMSRVFSGKHHVADVIAGAALGIVAAEAAAEVGFGGPGQPSPPPE